MRPDPLICLPLFFSPLAVLELCFLKLEIRARQDLRIGQVCHNDSMSSHVLTLLLESLHNSATRFMLEHKMLRKPVDPQKACAYLIPTWTFVETESILTRFVHLDLDEKAHSMEIKPLKLSPAFRSNRTIRRRQPSRYAPSKARCNLKGPRPRVPACAGQWWGEPRIAFVPPSSSERPV